MDDVEQLIVNQLRRTDRAIEKRQKLLSRVVDEPVKGRTFNRRYALEFSFSPDPDGTTPVSPQTRSFVVEKDCKRFFCQELVATTLIVASRYPLGNNPVPPANKLTISPSAAWRLMPYTWIVRDTSTDREWSDTPLPCTYVQQGHVGGYRLPSWAVLEPGSEVQVTIAPNFVSPQLSPEFVIVSKAEIVFSFIGFEVL